MFSRPASTRAVAGVAAERSRLVPAAVAVAVGTCAAVLLGLGGASPVVTGARAGYSSAPSLIVLAAAPVVLAAVLLWWRHTGAAAGVLAGAAALVPGRVVLDLQFVVDAAEVSRPALYLPDTLGSPQAAVGLWLLIAGEVVLALAGVLAVRAGRHGAEPDAAAPEHTGYAGHAGHAGQSARGPRSSLLLAVCVAAVAALGLLMAPFTSADPYVLARSALGADGLVPLGSLVLAAAIPLVAALAASSGRPEFARGCLAGLACGVLTVAVPDLFAALSIGALGVSAGPIVAIAGSAGLFALAVLRRRDRQAGQPDDVAGHASVPSRRRLEVATGLVAVLACAAALVGASTSQVTAATGASVGESPTSWSLVVAGLLLGALGVGMLVRRYAATLRPALSVAWVAVPLNGMAVLGAGVAAGQTGGVLVPGPGALWAVFAMLLATASGCVSVVAGVVEREDVQLGAVGGRSRLAALAGGVLAVGGFALPVAESAGYAGPGLVVNTVTASWGLLIGLLAVLAAVALAPRCRPARAAALLGGAACVLGLRVAEWPLADVRVGGLEPGVGWWFALAGAVALLAAAGMAATGAGSPSSRAAAHAF